MYDKEGASEEDEDAEHQAACCLMQLQCGHVAACAEHFPLHSTADWREVCAHVCTPCYFIYLFTVTWAYFYLFRLKGDLCLCYFMLADRLTFGFSTGRRIWITSILVKNRGDQCGAQVRSASTTEQCETPPTTLSIPPLISLNEQERQISQNPPHYCNNVSRNKERVTVLHESLKVFSLWWKLGQSLTNINTHKTLTWSDSKPCTCINQSKKKVESSCLNKEGKFLTTLFRL